MTFNALDFDAGGADDGQAVAALGARAIGPRAADGRSAPLYGFSDDAESSEFSANVLNYWNLLVKWRYLLIASLVIGLAIAVTLTMLTTPVYRAEATIQIDDEAPKVKPVDRQGAALSSSADKYYQTEYELLHSRSLAERVVDNEGLVNDDRFLNQWRRKKPVAGADRLAFRTPADRSARAAGAAGLIMGGLHIEPVRMSRLVKIAYESPDPALAAKIANAIGDNFITWDRERRYDASAAARKFLEDRLQQTREALENAQRRGNDYAQKNQLITLSGGGSSQDGKSSSPSSGESLIAVNLAAADQALSAATATRIQAEQRWRQAQTLPDLSLPDVISNSAVGALKSSLEAAEAEYQQNLRLYKPDYPSMVEAKGKINTLTQQLAAQAKSIRDSLQAQFQLSSNSEHQLQGQVEALKGQILQAQGKRVEQGFIDTDVVTSKTLYDSMLATYKEIGIAGAVSESNISFVDKAMVPHLPFKPDLKGNLIKFGAFGLIAGLGLAFLLEAFDLTLKVPQDAEKHLGIPMLGSIPVVRGDETVGHSLESPKSHLSEGYYSVRTALQFATEDGVPPSLVVTSSSPGEGKTTSCVAIASSFARLGLRVLLIDADLRNPSLHKILARDNGVGLSNVLAGNSKVGPALQPTNWDNLTFLASGPLPPNPAELLGGKKMASFIQTAKQHYDIVIIDSAPVMGIADAPQLGGIVDGVIIVVEAGGTKRDVAKAAIRRMTASNSKIIGGVFNKFDARKAGYAYGNHYGAAYGYGYAYGGDAGVISRFPGGRLLGFGKRKAA